MLSYSDDIMKIKCECQQILGFAHPPQGSNKQSKHVFIAGQIRNLEQTIMNYLNIAFLKNKEEYNLASKYKRNISIVVSESLSYYLDYYTNTHDKTQ